MANLAGARNHAWTAIAVTAVAISLLLANCYGFSTEELPDGSRFLNHGWPTINMVRSAWWLDPTQPAWVDTTRWAFQRVPSLHLLQWWNPSSICINAVTAAIVLACTWLVMRNRAQALAWRITLSELLIFIAIASALMALARHGDYWPTVTWKPLVFFPILFGIWCVTVVLTSLLTFVWRLIFRRGEKSAEAAELH